MISVKSKSFKENGMAILGVRQANKQEKNAAYGFNTMSAFANVNREEETL